MTDRIPSPLAARLAPLVLLAACGHHEPPAAGAAAPPAKPASTTPDASGAGVQDKLVAAKLARARADVAAIESAVQQYATNNAGHYPDTLVPLVTPDANGATYLKATVLPKDPWGREYQYDPPGAGQATPRISTLGRDGRPGGTGEDADVDNSAARAGAPR